VIIPWGTDAPIYYRPYTTMAVITACLFSFFAFPADRFEAGMLALGHGVHPLQWFTNLFMHHGLDHLIGNMIFLWAFGLVVEGKVGPLRFLFLFLGIGILESLIVQITFLHAQQSFMLGASGAIYGIMALCLVWAPRNEIQCLWFIRLFPSDQEIPILWFVILYVALDFFWVLLQGFQPSGELAHLLGAAVGFLTGSVMVKWNLVDCEDWDLFSVLAGRRGEKRSPQRGPKPKPKPQTTKAVGARSQSTARETAKSNRDPALRRTARLRELLDAHELEAAMDVYRAGNARGWTPPLSDHRDLIRGLIQHQDWPAAAQVLTGYLKNSPAPEPNALLKLAEILIFQVNRPILAIRVLDLLATRQLSPSLQNVREQLKTEAERRRDDEDGTLEIDDDSDWPPKA